MRAAAEQIERGIILNRQAAALTDAWAHAADCCQPRRLRLSRCWTAPELYEDLRVDPIAEFARHRIGTLLPQPLSLIAQLPTFQSKQINAGALATFVQCQRFAVS
jgi:hypothetical protein